jgi:hypothetical protein
VIGREDLDVSNRNNQLNKSEMNQENFENDLDWLAFRYISDELPEEERDLFEQSLAENQAAREAVANAMQQSQLMYAVFDTQSSDVADAVSVGEKSSPGSNSHRHISRRSLSRTLLNLAAAMLLMVGGLVWYSQVSHDSGAYGPVGRAVPELGNDEVEASAWVTTLGQSASQGTSSEFALLDEELLYTDAVYEPSESDNDWMLVALVDLESDEESVLLSEEN